MGIGDSLKKWARSKATEVLTADTGKHDSAAADAAAAESQARSDLGETLLRAAFPKLGEMADKQKADKSARELAEEQQRRDEVASLPLATVQLRSPATPAASGRACTGPAATSHPTTRRRPTPTPIGRGSGSSCSRRTPRAPTSAGRP